MDFSLTQEQEDVVTAAREFALGEFEFWAVDAGIGSAVLSTIFGADIIDMYGTEEQKKKYLPAFARGDLIMGTAITLPRQEPGASLT
ncbi:MAG: acyl-CoA dehydrogenase family protein [Deltaproteobacteria bacterium]|nr:acyl-CoA dehydrogenase family protein [Deltaproteobacteria bacterium]